MSGNDVRLYRIADFTATKFTESTVCITYKRIKKYFINKILDYYIK